MAFHLCLSISEPQQKRVKRTCVAHCSRGFVCMHNLHAGPNIKTFYKNTLAQILTPHCTIISLTSHSAIMLATHSILLHTHTHTRTCILPTNTRNSHTQNTHMYREEGLPQYLPEIAIQPVTFINYNRTVSMGCTSSMRHTPTLRSIVRSLEHNQVSSSSNFVLASYPGTHAKDHGLRDTWQHSHVC